MEHVIDEKSPLYGHTHESLEALNAEIIVTFEGTTEFGNPFMTRQSYLAEQVGVWVCICACVCVWQGVHEFEGGSLSVQPLLMRRQSCLAKRVRAA